MKKPTDLDVLKGYKEIAHDNKPEKFIIPLSLAGSLIFIMFFMHELSGEHPAQKPIVIGTIVLISFVVLIYALFNRCSKCRSPLVRISNRAVPNELLVVCTSCKCFYREIDSVGA